MADKRMFSQKIVESDAFGELPLSAQALYFHINMACDDDGFTNRVKAICRYIGASQEDIDALVNARFIISFGNGVYCVKHWLINNNQRKDRYHPTQYQDEYAQLTIKNNQAYTEKTLVAIDGCQLVAIDGIPSTETEVVAIDGIPRIEENKREESKIKENKRGECRGEDGATETSGAATPDSHSVHSSSFFGSYQNVRLTQQEVAKLKMMFPKDWATKIEQMSEYLFYGGKADNHYELMLTFG